MGAVIPRLISVAHQIICCKGVGEIGTVEFCQQHFIVFGPSVDDEAVSLSDDVPL